MENSMGILVQRHAFGHNKMKKIILVISFAVVVIVFLTAFYRGTLEPELFQLPIINPEDVPPALVDRKYSENTVNHQIPEFTFQDQSGKWISRNEVAGKISIVNFFFTTCPVVCPTLTRSLLKVQDAYLNDNRVVILSHTVFPEYDTAVVLEDYGKQYGVTPGKWHLLTGDKNELYAIARKGYFAVNKQSDGDFIHTENFVLVDWNHRIRGIYNGTSAFSVNQLIEDIRILLNEMKRDVKV